MNSYKNENNNSLIWSLNVLHNVPSFSDRTAPTALRVSEQPALSDLIGDARSGCPTMAHPEYANLLRLGDLT